MENRPARYSRVSRTGIEVSARELQGTVESLRALAPINEALRSLRRLAPCVTSADVGECRRPYRVWRFCA